MDSEKVLEFAVRYVWPLVLGWNIYLYKCQSKLQSDQKTQQIESSKKLADHKLFIVENYISKSDLREMFKSLEDSLDKRLTQFEKIVNR